MTAKKKGFALRNFNDAGTEQRFEQGAAVELDAGTYANYAAAGLVGDRKPSAPSAEDAAPTA